MPSVTQAAAPRQFQQLAMFSTPHEILSKYQPLDADREYVVDDWDAPAEEFRWETDEELWDRKFEESHGRRTRVDNGGEKYESLHDNIFREGVKNPVSLQFTEHRGSQGMPQILGGHHRLAVAAAYRPDEPIPVEHFPEIEAARRSLGRHY